MADDPLVVAGRMLLMILWSAMMIIVGIGIGMAIAG